MIFVLGLLEWADGVFLGSQGNKTEQVALSDAPRMCFLTPPAAVANVYYLHLQST